MLNTPTPGSRKRIPVIMQKYSDVNYLIAVPQLKNIDIYGRARMGIG